MGSTTQAEAPQLSVASPRPRLGSHSLQRGLPVSRRLTRIKEREVFSDA
jgi:hypothetical protein